MKQQENRAVIAWRGAASAGLVSSADRAYRKAPVPLPALDFGTKCPELVDTLTKKRSGFLSKLKWAGSHFKGFPALIACQQRWAKLSTAAHLCAVHLDRPPARLALQFPITLINAFSFQSPLLQSKTVWGLTINIS